MAFDLAKVGPNKQIQPVDLVAPGSRGLNTVESGTLMDPSYCTTAINAVVDIASRLAARNGTTNQTTIPIAGLPSVLTIFEFNAGAGVFQNIIAWNGGISNNISTPVAGSIAGTAPTANGRWHMVNFNNKLIGFQPGTKPAVYSIATPLWNTVVESSGSAPTGGVGTAAFGRLWAVQSDLQTIQYTGLLNETDWGAADAGLIDMHTIWSDGTDQVTAIFAWNAALVVCGLKHIIFFTDGTGSLLGLNPTQAYVFDEVLGTGCLSQFTVEPIGESDIVFLSPNGVQSLARLTGNRDNPIGNMTKFCRDTFLAQVANEVAVNITGNYNPVTGFYLVSLPISNTVWCLDMRRRYMDEVGNLNAIMTTWIMKATAVYSTHANLLYIARNPGTVSLYGGFSDDGVQYTYQYIGPWMSMGAMINTGTNPFQNISQRLKLLKRFEVIVYTAGGANLNLSWSTDFGAENGAASISVPTLGANSQYGIGQYGLAQYGGGASLLILEYPARARGQYYQIGVSTAVIGAFGLQQAQLAVKVGRIA